jgi:hypothetical protein
MVMNSRRALVLLSLMLLLAASTRAMGQGTVLRVIVVETENVDGYIKELEHGKAMLKSSGSPAQLRVWQATFAGPNTGTVVVSVEYPSLTAFADDNAKLKANAEYQTWLKGLDRIRKITSDSLYNELGT